MLQYLKREISSWGSVNQYCIAGIITGQPGPMEVLCGALFAGSATSSSSTHAEASALLCGSAGGEKIQVYSRLDGGEATVDDLDFNTADSSRGVLRGRQMTDN
jgi:hypothetical protein